MARESFSCCGGVDWNKKLQVIKEAGRDRDVLMESKAELRRMCVDLGGLVHVLDDGLDTLGKTPWVQSLS
eukprot:9164554-Prorocentrum_lima.AAC.1